MTVLKQEFYNEAVLFTATQHNYFINILHIYVCNRSQSNSQIFPSSVQPDHLHLSPRAFQQMQRTRTGISQLPLSNTAPSLFPGKYCTKCH